MYIRLTPLLSLMLIISAAHATDELSIIRNVAIDFCDSIAISDDHLPAFMTYLDRAGLAARSEHNFVQAYDAAMHSLAEYKAASAQQSANQANLARQVACLNHFRQQNIARKAALAEIEAYISEHEEYQELFTQLSEYVQRVTAEIFIYHEESLNVNLAGVYVLLKNNSIQFIGNTCNNVSQNWQDDPVMKAGIVFRVSEMLHKEIVEAVNAQSLLKESLCLMLVTAATFFDDCYELVQIRSRNI